MVFLSVCGVLGVVVWGSTTQIALSCYICLVHVVNAPLAASNWYSTLTCGSSKLGSSQRPHPGQPSRNSHLWAPRSWVLPSGHTPGNRHDRGLTQGKVSGVVCAFTPGVSDSRTSHLPLSKRPTVEAARMSSLTLAAWNVRSLLDNPRSTRPERRTALVVRELERYKVYIAGLSETRFSEQGQLEEVGAGYTFFWSGRPKAEQRDAGRTLSRNTKMYGEVSQRISKASQAFGRLKASVWNRHGIHLNTKLKMYKAIVLTVWNRHGIHLKTKLKMYKAIVLTTPFMKRRPGPSTQTMPGS
ncbi:unnamed protein product [Schistocephalus solidus]|uniref:DDE Tnp4 domain-containing protein n=1 Tax=Schistocephalus solidus TaxID=70667 RepID=A0A183SQU5_SCHSO|nr:unnamed protein product [Schistocephalus solidus]